MVDTNPELEGQKNGTMNCACKLVLDELSKSKSKRNEFKKKHINKINAKYLATGIGNEGLQELADKSYMTLVVKDKLGKVWRGQERQETAIISPQQSYFIRRTGRFRGRRRRRF